MVVFRGLIPSSPSTGYRQLIQDLGSIREKSRPTREINISTVTIEDYYYPVNPGFPDTMTHTPSIKPILIDLLRRLPILMFAGVR
jgi:hypothetical protein